MTMDYQGEFERISKEIFATALSAPAAGYIPAKGGVYFRESLVQAALKAAEEALRVDSELDLLRLSRATLLQDIGRLQEAEIDVDHLIKSKGPCAAPARLMKKQIRSLS